MSATSSLKNKLLRRDFDRFDRLCDHLLVIAPKRRRLVPYVSGAVVGTFRLMRREIADAHRGFYSADKFDLSPLLRRHHACLELGRSCVDPDYRKRAVIDRLWRAIAGYVTEYDIDLMFGCASLPGTDIDTFGPEVKFVKAPREGQANLPPSDGLQFFGQVDIDGASEVLTVQLKDLTGATLFTQELEPEA